MFGKKKQQNSQLVLGFSIDGLPVPSGTNLMIKLDEQGLTITSPDFKDQYEITLNRIDKISLYSETQIEKVISQSAPGMIIGAAAFGVLGAMIGGRVKTKEKKIINYFLLIDFEGKQVVIRSTLPADAEKMIKLFEYLKPSPNSTIIQL